MAKKNEKNVKLAKSAKASKSAKAPLALLDPTASEQAIEQAQAQAEQAIEATTLPGTLAEGMLSYLCYDEQTGSVFVSEQLATRAYVSAVIADSPLGRKVVRLTSDHKAALRYAKAINFKGASHCSNAIVVSVTTDDKPHREQVKQGVETEVTRNPKVKWNAAIEAQRIASEAQADN